MIHHNTLDVALKIIDNGFKCSDETLENIIDELEICLECTPMSEEDEELLMKLSDAYGAFEDEQMYRQHSNWINQQNGNSDEPIPPHLSSYIIKSIKQQQQQEKQ